MQQELTELLKVVENDRGRLKSAQAKKDASGISFEANRLAKNLFAVARFYYGKKSFENVLPYIIEAHQLVGASLESSYFLMHSLSELGKWDEAYTVFRESRKHFAGEWKHPLYIDPDTTLEHLKGLGRKVVDNCQRLHQPIMEADYQDWHWNKRFLDYREFLMIAEAYYPPGTETNVIFHPFIFRPCERKFDFHGLVTRDIPFKFESSDSLEIGREYPVKVKYLLTTQSNVGKEDAASWLEVSLVSRTDL